MLQSCCLIVVRIVVLIVVLIVVRIVVLIVVLIVVWSWQKGCLQGYRL